VCFRSPPPGGFFRGRGPFLWFRGPRDLLQSPFWDCLEGPPQSVTRFFFWCEIALQNKTKNRPTPDQRSKRISPSHQKKNWGRAHGAGVSAETISEGGLEKVSGASEPKEGASASEKASRGRTTETHSTGAVLKQQIRESYKRNFYCL